MPGSQSVDGCLSQNIKFCYSVLRIGIIQLVIFRLEADFSAPAFLDPRLVPLQLLNYRVFKEVSLLK